VKAGTRAREQGMSSSGVVVAMSGGVDSSVAALLLVREGIDVLGVTMSTGYGSRSRSGSPAGTVDIEAAGAVCGMLGIEHTVVPVGPELERMVIEPSLLAYREGMTPNPCIICNRLIKFGVLIEGLSGRGRELTATGHYARISRRAGRAALAAARDREKDQSYFLHSVPRERLEKVLFPLGGLTKGEVVRLAEEAGLPVSGGRESQDACFLSGSWDEFFRERGVEDRSGDILSVEGEVVGTHRGVFRYTVGQRRGLGISAPEPMYVLSIDKRRNVLVVGTEDLLYSRSLVAEPSGFLPGDEEGEAEAKIRYNHDPAPCRYRTEGAELIVDFEEPQRAITPGQSVVLYEDGVVLGGGVILKTGPE